MIFRYSQNWRNPSIRSGMMIVVEPELKAKRTKQVQSSVLPALPQKKESEWNAQGKARLHESLKVEVAAAQNWFVLNKEWKDGPLCG